MERITAKYTIIKSLQTLEKKYGLGPICWHQLPTVDLRVIREMMRHQRDEAYRTGYRKGNRDGVAER